MPATRQSALLHDLFTQRTGPMPLESLLKPNRGIMIYGAGNCGRDVQKVLWNHSIAVEGFLDTRIAHGTSIQGTPVFHPDDKSIGPAKRAQVQVIVAIFNRETNIASIQEFLRIIGYEHLTTFLEFHRRFPTGELIVEINTFCFSRQSARAIGVHSHSEHRCVQ